MSMKSRINKLARQIEGDLNGECKCPGVEMTFAVVSTEQPVPPPQDICRVCQRKIPQHVFMLVYDHEVQRPGVGGA